MSLEKIVITSPELTAAKSVCRSKLSNPLVNFYEKMKAKTCGRSGIISLEGNLSIEAIETFFGAYSVIKQKLSKTQAAALGDCREALGLYAVYVAASYAYTSISKHIENESSYSDISIIKDADDEYLLINNLAKNYLQGTAICRTGRDLAEKTKGYFARIKSVAQRALSTGKYSHMIQELQKSVEINFEKDNQSFSALKQKKTKKKKKRKKEDESITFKDVGGQHEAKSQLIYLVKSVTHPDRAKFGYKPPRGVFFYGHPGTGKTLAAKALANECGMEFHYIDLSDIVSKWYGESEQNLKEALTQPGIKFMDEFNSLGKVHQDNEGISQKLVNILAEVMNGYDSYEGIIVAASNSLKIDKKLKRAGRFDRFIYFGPPNLQDTEEILMIHLRLLQQDAQVQLFNGVNAPQISRALYTKSQAEQRQNPEIAIVGADIAEIARRAHERKWNHYLDTGSFVKIGTSDFLEEIKRYNLKERFANEF